jgi:hypothetical protein
VNDACFFWCSYVELVLWKVAVRIANLHAQS